MMVRSKKSSTFI